MYKCNRTSQFSFQDCIVRIVPVYQVRTCVWRTGLMRHRVESYCCWSLVFKTDFLCVKYMPVCSICSVVIVPCMKMVPEIIPVDFFVF
jgi:hypothetical protein